MVAPTPPDPKKVDAFMGKLVQDMGALAHAPTVLVGEQLGLYKTLAEEGPMTAVELAKMTHTEPRLLRDWLGAQAAAGYVDYDATQQRFSLSPEQRFVLVDTSGPDVTGAFILASALANDWRKIAESYKSGKGMGWHEHHQDLFVGTERFFRPGYVANLVPNWLPTLDGVVSKLTNGAKVADVGCGHGASTIVLARAFPKSKFFGFDYHAPSIEAARVAAKEAGVDDRITFEVAEADGFPGKDYDLVAFFDCLHDMGDPAGASAHVRASLKSDGTWLLVEPFANEKFEDNINPVGRVFFSASSLVCAPAALAQGGKEVLGAQSPESVLKGIAHRAGFSKFRLATSTPFNRVFEVRP